ncbi:unnamed protein product [Phytophthora fragariaefolia]|uniref:Unnamed protein product n=1 Tax=Phytophthora fragariaefolia TaxID=1490495 RepID=A0A9W6XD17_9STRA|nr:unnamed protein product [Phytophthora fragariaefolia]
MPTPEVRKEMGEEMWMRGFADNRVNHAATHAYTIVSAEKSENRDGEYTVIPKLAKNKSNKPTTPNEPQLAGEGRSTPNARNDDSAGTQKKLQRKTRKGSSAGSAQKQPREANQDDKKGGNTDTSSKPHRDDKIDHKTDTTSKPQYDTKKKRNTATPPKPQHDAKKDDNTGSTPIRQRRAENNDNANTTPQPQRDGKNDGNTATPSKPQHDPMRNDNAGIQPKPQCDAKNNENTGIPPKPQREAKNDIPPKRRRGANKDDNTGNPTKPQPGTKKDGNTGTPTKPYRESTKDDNTDSPQNPQPSKVVASDPQKELISSQTTTTLRKRARPNEDEKVHTIMDSSCGKIAVSPRGQPRKQTQPANFLFVRPDDHVTKNVSNSISSAKVPSVEARKYGKTPKRLKTPKRSPTNLPSYSLPYARALQTRNERHKARTRARHETPKAVSATIEHTKVGVRRLSSDPSSNKGPSSPVASLAKLTEATLEANEKLVSVEHALVDKITELTEKSAKAEELGRKCAALGMVLNLELMPSQSASCIVALCSNLFLVISSQTLLYAPPQQSPLTNYSQKNLCNLAPGIYCATIRQLAGCSILGRQHL